MHLTVSDYLIQFGSAKEALQAFLEDNHYSKILVLVDENTSALCYPLIKENLPGHTIIQISSGESHKNLETCHQIWSQLLENNADRHSLLINLGGGVIGDMGGFVASTYMRGIDFVQIPTTLLSQVDASVGGKLGVDFKGLKNFIGLFQNPKEVIIDSSFLQTLSPEELRSGFAEMIKHALIRDVKMWKRYIDTKDWKSLLTGEELKDSVNIKRKVVINDPFEKGERKVLNFGHTLGHAIETYSFQTEHPLLHGEAIALGIIGETYLSHKILGLSEKDLNEVKDYVSSVYNLETLLYQDFDKIMEFMKHDKKNKSGKVMFSLLDSLGHCVFDVEVGAEMIRESLGYVLS